MVDDINESINIDAVATALEPADIDDSIFEVPKTEVRVTGRRGGETAKSWGGGQKAGDAGIPQPTGQDTHVTEPAAAAATAAAPPPAVARAVPTTAGATDEAAHPVPVLPPLEIAKRRRTTISTSQKLEILSEVEKPGAPSVQVIAAKHNVSFTSIYRWRKESEILRRRLAQKEQQRGRGARKRKGGDGEDAASNKMPGNRYGGERPMALPPWAEARFRESTEDVAKNAVEDAIQKLYG